MLNFFKREKKETFADKWGDLYETVPVNGRTKILEENIGLDGNKGVEYYIKTSGSMPMDSIEEYLSINDKNKGPISAAGFDVTGKYHIFANYNLSNLSNESIEKGEEPNKYWIHQVEKTDPNLYKKIGKDPNYKPPSPSQDSTTQSYEPSHNDHNGNPLWGGRKRRRNSKKRNTKRRNSKKRRSHKRR